MLDALLICIIAIYYFFLIGLMLYMFKVRTKAVREERVSYKNFKSYTTDSPEDLVVLQNNYNNHFQIPIFFTVACSVALSQNTVSVMTVSLALIFILSRVIHSYIHLGSNKLVHRAYSFFSGVIAVGLIYLEVVYKALEKVLL